MNKAEKKKLAQSLGSLGGKATKKKYGKTHYVNMVNKRWDSIKAKNIGKMDGELK